MSEPSVPPHPDTAAGTWSANTKLLASLLFLVLAGLALWRFDHLIQPIVLAVVLAYLMHPPVTYLARLPFLNRATAALLVMVLLLLLGSFAFLWLGGTAVQQINLLIRALPAMTANAQAFLQTALPTTAGFVQDLAARPGLQFLAVPWERFILPLTNEAFLPATDETILQWNLEAITNQALALLDPVIKQGSSFATSVAVGTFNALATGVLIIILSLYIIIDIPKVRGTIGRLAPVQSIQDDMKALWQRFTRIWAAYLRGQITISILMFLIVSLLLSVLGVRNALGLGLVAGAMEFLPVIGPVISSLLAILVALFQGTTAFGLTTVNYVILVALVLIILQQLEGNILVPRMIGNQLKLHPLVVFLSVLMGTSLAGILGAILAAPVVATLKLLGTYTWYRILDQPLTFLADEAEDTDSDMDTLSRWQRLRRLLMPGSAAASPPPAEIADNDAEPEPDPVQSEPPKTGNG